MKNKSLLKYLLIILLLSIPSVFALFKSGFFTTDDGSWMIIRFSAFYEALRNGQFPVRFLPRLNQGFGYPVANFLYPLFMYIGTPIHILGFSFINTIKMIFGLSLVSSALFSFLWLRKRFENLSSFIGSLVYLYFPYHLWDVYKRGSLGEVLALAIVPFILWQIERNSLFFVSVGIAFLILAHNTLAILFLPLIILYFWFCKKSVKKILLTLLFGLGISCFFWLPALYERKFVIFDKIMVSDYNGYFIKLQDLNLIGLTFLISFLLSFIFIKKIKDKNYWLFFVASVVSLFFIFQVSQFIWPIIASYIQFPFRFISVLVLTSAFFVSYQLNVLGKKYRMILIAIYIIVLAFGARSFIYPKETTNLPDTFYSTNVDTTTVKNEYMPIWIKKIPDSLPLEKIIVLKGNAKISKPTANGNMISFDISAKNKSLVLINTVYYPGWKVNIDKKETKIDYKNSGLIQFLVEPGSRVIQVKFTETPLRLFADIFSIAFLIGLFYYCFKTRPE
jgi:hypothetical protein